MTTGTFSFSAAWRRLGLPRRVRRRDAGIADSLFELPGNDRVEEEAGSWVLECERREGDILARRLDVGLPNPDPTEGDLIIPLRSEGGLGAAVPIRILVTWSLFILATVWRCLSKCKLSWGGDIYSVRRPWGSGRRLGLGETRIQSAEFSSSASTSIISSLHAAGLLALRDALVA